MIRNPTPYPSPAVASTGGTPARRCSPQARRGENSPNLSQASKGGNASELSQASKGGNTSDLWQPSTGGNVPLSAGEEVGRGVRFYVVIEEETQ